MRYLYHVSREWHREKILKRGLRPMKPTSKSGNYLHSAYLSKQPAGVYVWPTFECARDWHAGYDNREILRFPRKGFRCYVDPYIGTIPPHTTRRSRALYISEAVDPDLLELVYEATCRLT